MNDDDDLTEQRELCEASILDGLERRFSDGRIYTCVGDILLSVNPYEPLPATYASELRGRFVAAVDPLGGERTAAPHIFALAARAYHALFVDSGGHAAGNQSIVINGESGAGKTEATKHILSLLTTAAGGDGGRGETVARQILAGTPLLEAFGNAKTVRNDNSSRFGKLIRLFFSDDARQLVGSRLTVYLLEKSRIARLGPGERNYHVFYQLLAGATPDERRAYRLLASAGDYRYLRSASSTLSIDGVDDAADFARLRRAMDTLHFDQRHTAAVFACLSAVLLLGNVTFEATADGCRVAAAASAALHDAAALLHVAPRDLEHTLCNRSMGSANRSSVYTIPLRVAEAEDGRDALAKTLYARLFDHLVATVNRTTAPPATARLRYVAVLDIFGFESFEHNSYEQLLINYANDKLFQHFNQHVFAAELADYRREALPATVDVAYPDNQTTIDLLEKRGAGLLYLLDEECRFPRGSDPSFLDKAHRQWQANAAWSKPTKAPTAAHFAIGHFAGQVLYSAAGFLDKNRDTLHNDLVGCIKKSTSTFLQALFDDSSESSPSSSSSSSSSSTPRKRTSTLSEQFRSSLNDLLALLTSTRPWFVRALKPNTAKRPRYFDRDEMARQIRNAGILACVQIRQAGFAYREPFANFFRRYEQLAGRSASSTPPTPAACHQLLQRVGIAPDSYAIGRTKVFLKTAATQQLDHARQAILVNAVIVFQKYARRWIARKKFIQLLADERQRLERERLELQRLEHERLEHERLEHERHEHQRLEHERHEHQRLEHERVERDRIERQRLEHERLEHERLEHERLERERQHLERRPDESMSTSFWGGLMEQSGQVCSTSLDDDAEYQRLLAIEQQATALLNQTLIAERLAKQQFAVKLQQCSVSSEQLPAFSAKRDVDEELPDSLSALALSPRRDGSRHGSQLQQLRGQFDSRKRSNTVEMLLQVKSHHQRSQSTSSSQHQRSHSSASSPSVARQSGDARVRGQVIAEILRTEEDYVRDLVLTIDVYMRQLRAAQDELRLSDSDVAAIFSTLDRLIPINRVVLDRLREATARPFEDQCVGAIFTELGDYLRMYSDYCSNQAAACELLKRLSKRNKRLDAQLDRIKRSNAELRGLSLEDFLIKPLQRLTRYPLLLRELLRHTAATHPDFALLDAAIAKIQNVVAEVNERQRQLENTERLSRLLVAFEKAGSAMPALQPSSRLLLDGDIKGVDGSGKLKRRKLVLFNDCLLVAKPRGSSSRLQLLRCVPMQLLGVDRVGRDECHFNHAFAVFEQHPSGDQEQSDFVVFSAKSAPARDQWIARLEQAASEHRARLEIKRSQSTVKAQNLKLLDIELGSMPSPTPLSLSSPSPSTSLCLSKSSGSVVVAPPGSLASFAGVAVGDGRYDTIRRRQFMEKLRQSKIDECAQTAADSNLAAPMNRR